MERYPEQFDAFSSALGDEPEWLFAARREALARFDALGGFPTRKNEEWKYTSLKNFARTPFEPVSTLRVDDVSSDSIDALDVPGVDARWVFVNGHFAPSLSRLDGLSLPEGARVQTLADAWSEPAVEVAIARDLASEPHAMTALNAAFVQDGLFVHVPRNVVIEQPLHLIFVSTNSRQPSVSHPRVVIVAESHSQVTLIETHASVGVEHAHATVAVLDARIEAGARVERFKLERDDEARGHHIGHARVWQGADSRYFQHTFTLSGALVRDDTDATLDGSGIECWLNGLYLTRGDQHVDHHTTIDHRQPHCNSFELYKGVLDDRSTGVFNGKIFVRKAAQKTDAKQSNRNILLSPRAVINTKPQLEIWADDVRCTHGATIGQLDETALFYLRSRGLSLDEARALLTYAFAGELVERVEHEALRDQLEAHVRGWFV